MKRTTTSLVIIAAVFVACTRNTLAKEFGGKQTIILPKGKRLIEATWKDDNIWYLTEEMDSTYTPKTKTLREKSSMELYEGEVVFVETK